MSKFLNGPGVQSALTDIIKDANEELRLISPYLKIPTQTKSYLKSIDKNDITIKIIYRTESSLNEDDLQFFSDLNNLELYNCDNLHSKCYMNDKEGIITSMNLHEHSQTHNWEMGIRFSKQYDYDIFTDVEKELSHLLSISQRRLVDRKGQGQYSPSHPPVKSPHKIVYKPKEAPNKGLFDKILDTVTGNAAYCIRCGEGLEKFNLERPLCNKCYPVWAKYKDIKYKEKYCHACGTQVSNISYEKPTCKDCFRRLYR